MTEALMDPNVWGALVSLTALEIVLGIDNVVFVSVITEGLPPDKARSARRIGLTLALLFRVLMLYAITGLTQLTWPLFSVLGKEISWHDIIMIGGGVFLIVKATQEIHGQIEGEHDEPGSAGRAGFASVVAHIILIDAVFSVDSIVTAIAMSDQINIMIVAVAIAIGIMYLASGPVSSFISRHPTTKMLALSFLMLIGMTLIAEGTGHAIPRTYIYAAMAFSVLVETFNVMAFRRRMARDVKAFSRKHEPAARHEPATKPGANSAPSKRHGRRKKGRGGAA